jgi:hypothetical protein
MPIKSIARQSTSGAYNSYNDNYSHLVRYVFADSCFIFDLVGFEAQD